MIGEMRVVRHAHGDDALRAPRIVLNPPVTSK